MDTKSLIFKILEKLYMHIYVYVYITTIKTLLCVNVHEYLGIDAHVLWCTWRVGVARGQLWGARSLLPLC